MFDRNGIRAFRSSLFAPLGIVAGLLAAFAAQADPFTITSPLAGRAVSGCTGVTISSGIVDSAGISPTSPTDKGNVASNGNVSLSGGTTVVYGDVSVGPGKKFTASGGSRATGTVTIATQNYDCNPIDLTAAKTALQTSNDNAKIPHTGFNKDPLIGTSHTDFSMSGGDSLTLAAGTYYFTSFNMSGGSTITLSGPVRIFCTGAVTVSGGSVAGSNGFGLHFWVSGTSKVDISSSTVKGFIYAPAAPATISSATLIGGVFANAVTISGSAHVTRLLDDIAPHLAITSPADGSNAIDLAHVLVTGTLTDDETDVSLKVNDQPVTVASDGTWQITFNFTGVASPATVTAVATDAGGNVATQTIKIVLDHTPPVIQFWETGKQLPTDAVTQFGRDAHIDIRVTDDLSTFTYTAKLDGQPYKSLDPITADGPHTVSVHAVDAPGNASDGQVSILIDKTAPVITLTESGKPLDAKYNRDIAIDIKVTDNLTAVTYTAKLDGNDYVSGAPITTEAKHVLLVTAKDNVGNQSSSQVTVLVDKSAPVISFYESNNKVDSTTARFKTDAHIEIRVNDVVSSATYTATLDGHPYNSLDTVSVDGWHKIVVNAVDEAGNPATATLDFLVDHNAPVVKFLESGSVLDPTQLAKYNRTAAIEIQVTDATSKATWSAKLNNVDYVSLTPISTEGKYTLSVHAVDEAGNVTDVALNLLIDKTPPVISFFDGTTQLDPRVTQKFRRDVSIDIKASDAVSSATFTATLDGQPYTPNTLITAEAVHQIAVHAVDPAGNTADATLDFIVDKTLPAIAFFESGVPLDTTKTTSFGRDAKVEIKVTDNLPNVTYTAKIDGNDYKSFDPITTDGTHVVSVHAIDAADNTADAQVSILVDKTPPVIAFYEGTTKLDTTSRQKFNHLPSITIKVTDATTAPNFTATLDGAAYTSGTPVGEGSHTILVHATDALNNPADAKLDLLVDQTPPVVKLKEGTNDLPPSGGIFNHDLSVKADITDVSQTTTVATLDGQPFSLSVAIASEGSHTLSVTVTDELNWSTTVGSSFIVDKTPPKISVFEGSNPLSAGSSFARDVVINFSAQDITTPTLTATLDGVAFTSGGTVSANGDHTLVVNGVDQANNHSDPVTIVFHIDKDAPEVVLLESAQAFPQKKTFTRDVVATVDIKAATQTTSLATIDGNSYNLGSPYAPEGKHHIKVVVTNIANLSTTVEADFTIDKTPPTIKLFAQDGVEFTDNMKFAADITPVAQADDNLSKPPKVVVTLDGHELAPGSVVSEEKFHTTSATATDDGGLSTTVGPYHFVIDKSGPKVTVTVDDKTLNDGDKFNKAITPKINVDDLTKTTITATLDGNAYTPDTLISDDAKHTLVVNVADDLGNVTKLDPIHFTIDKTPPVVTISENGAPFVSGSKYKRNVTPAVNITDLTETTTVATIDGNPWTSGQEVSSEGVHKLNVTVTDELAWSTVVPEITFTIDKTPPAVKITESDAPLVDGQIFNRDTHPKITVTDTTSTTIEATLLTEGTVQPFTSEALVAIEGNHTLAVKVTDELGFVTTVPPISFVVDKTPPVVTIIESGKAFADNSLLNHDALPHANIVDVTATTVTAKLDGVDYTLDTAIPVEGAHALDVSVKDAAGWVTTVPTIHFFIDKTPPVVAVTESGNPLVSGAEFNRTIKPNIKVTDISATTVDGKLDGQPYTSDTDIAAEGEHTLTVTATDAAQWSTTIPPITFVIDKTAPQVTIKESGAPFVSGSKFNRDVLPQIIVVDLTKTTIDAKLDGNAYTPDTPITTDGNHTLTITVTDHLGQATVVPPIAFTLDKTPPVVAITESGKPLATGAIFSRTIKPEIAIQDLTQTTTVALLDDKPFTFGADIAAEGRHMLNVAVTDDLGWTTTVPPIAFAIDKTPPDVTLVEDNKPFTTGSLFNRDVKPEAVIKDTTDTTTTATLDGNAFTLGTTISAEGKHTLIVKVTDSVGLTTTLDPVVFTIDKTAPSISFLTPSPNSTISTASIVVTGDADDAVTVEVNGVPADVDTTTKKFTTSAPIDLLEGENTLVATATDKAGNTGATTVKVFLDSRAPELAVTSPAANFCTKDLTINIAGRSADAHASEVKISIAPGSVAPVTVTPAADGSFSASITAPNEGQFLISVEAKDAVGHVATTAIPVVVDKTAPVITVNSRGVPFAGGPISYQPALFVTVNDTDATTSVTTTLNGNPYTSGSAITGDGSYTLKVNAQDCAGNAAAETTISFVVDTHAPKIVTIDPAAGTTITTSSKTISGTMEQADTRSLTIAGTPYVATLNGTSFSFAGVALNEGINQFNLIAVDLAGNTSTTGYSFNVKTTTPAVTITEGGAPIAPNAIFNRTVVPSIRTDEAGAKITATLDGAAYISETPISAEGAHTIQATASDDFGHSSSATATFTIDRGAPAVTITSPTDGFSTTADNIEVRGTAAGGNVAGVTVNSVVATVAADGSFTASNVPLDFGPNAIIATALDRAGNRGSATITVNRGSDKFDIALTTPADKTLTNRHTVTVAGQLLSHANSGTVSINGVDVPLDATGAFKKTDFALTEGDNVITATVRGSGGATNSASVTVTADFTPPVLKVLADASALQNDSRFATSPTITIQATDTRPEAVTVKLTVDGSIVSPPVSGLADGGHALTAIARDGAGNEARIDRTFAVGAGASTGGSCSLSAFDPPNNSSVYSDTIKISGRSGASNVLVNGVRAQIADGSFTAQVTLQPGRNDIEIRCADANGNATTDTPSILTLYRYTDATITITSPHNDDVATSDKVTVAGTVTDGVVSGDVNGVAFTPAGGAYSVSNVPLASGLNIISAHARTSSARSATANVRVKYFGGTPQIAITSPLPATHTGASAIDVSGVYTNVDSSTITVNGAPATVKAQSETTGTFTIASVALPAATTTTITATARNRANVSVSATTDVTSDSTASITITSPSDNSYYASTATTVHITGTFAPVQGSLVQVNGTSATLDANGNFNADVDLSTATSASIPIVARVSTADGQSATDAIRIVRFAAPLTVKDTFPAQNAVEVDRGSLVVVLFSNALDASTINGACKLTDGGGATIDGETFVDNDAVSFAPIAPLTAGMHYTLTVSQTLKDLAGGTLASPYSLGFTVASTAPATPPTVDQTDATGCFTSTTITGKATTPGARVRLDVDGVTLTTTSDATTGNFSFAFTFSGQAGFHIARVRQIGTDGTLSPERAITYRINCAGPQVLSALLDRAAKTVTITFSKPMNAASLVASPTGSILIVPNNGTALNGNVALNVSGDVATVTFTDDVTTAAVVLTVKKSAADTTGQTMAADYTQTFTIGSDTPVGGYVSGAIYDATNGRPLAGAQVDITAPVSAFSRRATAQSTSTPRMQPVVFANGPATSDDHGRYTRPLDEGAYTIQAAASGYTTVWRQILVPAGTGVIPIDIRLTKRGAEQTTSTSALTFQNGGDTTVTKKVELSLPAAALAPAHRVRLTSLGGQSLAGLLPLGWSPAAATEIAVDDSPLPVAIPGSRLTFDLSTTDVAAITAASQTLSLVAYDSDRDEWRVVSAVANVGSDGKVAFDISNSGNYALVYADKAATLPHPPAARAGAPLAGVSNPCGTAPDTCRLTSKSFDFLPKSVLPNGRAVATLVTDGTTKTYPSGTAVQAFIDEQLNLADGRVVIDPPFATDLLVYRNFAGDSGVADFHLSPTTQATVVTLRDGVDHVRIVDYPGRIDRGALIGAEGGRVPGDDGITIDIPTGATTDALHASAATISDLSQFPSIAGFHVVGAFSFSLTRATEPTPVDLDGDGKPDPVAPPVLTKAARATFAIPSTSSQVIVAELLPNTVFGVGVRLAAQASVLQQNVDVPNVKYYSTKSVDASALPVDGIIRNGAYLILTADNPIAFAKGTVIVGGGTAAITGARVTAGIGSPQTSALGVIDITRAGGTFAIPVAAKPAAPFSILPRSTSIGDGTAWPSQSSPDPDQIVNVGAVPLFANPPSLTSLAPANGSVKNTIDPFVVTATFDTALDTSTAALSGAIVVRNMTKDATVAGTITGASNVITFTASTRFDAGTQYSITLSPGIRAANGAAYGKTTVALFSTPDVPVADGTIHPELIHITVPDADGKSLITGKPGALPAGAQAVAVRRGTFFITQYQATVAADKSFSFTAGGGVDAIAMGDYIDLQVIDAVSRAIIAVIPLTPFVTADGNGFVAPIDRTVTFTNDSGVSVTVPAGSFDTPTVVTLAPSAKTDFAQVPHFDDELEYAGSIKINFDGVAKNRLDVEIPVPAGTDTSKYFILGLLSDSIRGPRVMAVDTLRIVNGKFTTADVAGSSSIINQPRATAFATVNGQAHVLDTLNGQQAKKYLLGVERSGIYNVMDIRNAAAGVAWGVMDGLQKAVDVFWDQLDSLFASHTYCLERGRIAIPLLPNKPFVLVGVDASTGLTAFQRAYDPLPAGDPGSITIVPSPDPPTQGPFPSFAAPFRVETITVDEPDENITAIRNFIVKYEGGYIKVANGTPALPADLNVTLFDVDNGNIATNRSNLKVQGKVGDRIMLIAEEADVDPNVALSVLFSNNIYTGTSTNAADIDTFLKTQLTLSTAPEPQNPGDPLIWSDAPGVSYSVDSGGRRVNIALPSSLQRGNHYRLKISDQLADKTGTGGTAGLHIGQAVVPVPGSTPPTTTTTPPRAMELYFRVRGPAGLKSSFDLYNSGQVRDQSLNGNVLFVAALNGGLLAYDSADPLQMGDNAILGYVPRGESDVWSVASDHHGRVYSTGVGSMFGVLRSYRLQDFLDAQKNFPAVGDISKRVVNLRSSAQISFALGASVNTALSSATIISTIPEAIPRKLQLLLQDRTVDFKNLDDFKNLVPVSPPSGPPVVVTGVTIQPSGAPEGDFEFYKATIVRDPDPAAPAPKLYVGQRVTVENVTLDMRWSADAYLSAPAVIDGIVARKNDELRIIWNEKTYGVVSLFGYGIGVYDLNAIESNDDPHRPTGYVAMREQIRITNAPLLADCHKPLPQPPPGTPVPPYVPPATAIPDLTFTPDAAILPKANTPDLMIYAVDALRGILDVTIHPPTTDDEARLPSDASGDLYDPSRDFLCNERPDSGLVFQTSWIDVSGQHHYYNPRIEKLRAKFTPLSVTPTSGPRPPYGRFSSASYYHWQLEKADNKTLWTASSGGSSTEIGARGSKAGTKVSRDYLLIPGNEYGLLVVEVGGTPPDPATGLNVSYNPLLDQHLVDIIWFPAGCYAARAIPRTNLATAIDGDGRVLLVDLSRIDERFKPTGGLIANDDLFPTVDKSLSANGSYGVGMDDPRIVWKSQKHVAVGTLPPWVDPDTGFMFLGKLLTPTTNVISAIDPHVTLKVDLGAADGLSEVGGIVPLGITPPINIVPTNKPNASLGAFRVELALPGALAEELTASGKKVKFAIESERVQSASTEQTPDGFPRSQLRLKRRDGTVDPRAVPANFTFERLVPPSKSAELRHQRGFNKFVSPWIVALADARASKDYNWTYPSSVSTDAQKKDFREKEGCGSCARPQSLQGLAEADGVFEWYSNGRLMCVRPETDLFTGTNYEFLGNSSRLEARFATVMADVIHPPDIAVAAQNPPVANGMFQMTTYLHSGEVETHVADLNAGGRGGWNVVIDRNYRSRTIAGSPLGFGWDSSMFARLRLMPSGQVEYRDGSGEVYIFANVAGSPAEYTTPPGLNLTLKRTDLGWSMNDEKRRFTFFDRLGRITARTDHFADAVSVDAGTALGNVIRYVYDSTGRLVNVVDPMNRVTKLTYWDPTQSSTLGYADGMLHEITDWRSRVVTYEYDTRGRLMNVKFPEAAKASDVPSTYDHTGNDRPRLSYSYEAVNPATSFTDYVDFAGNLDTIMDPEETKNGGLWRVVITYDTSTDATKRDHIHFEDAPCGSFTSGSCVPRQAVFIFSDPTAPGTFDLLNQQRTYNLAEGPDKRMHVTKEIVNDVPVINEVAGTSLPDKALPTLAAQSAQLKTEYNTYNENGEIVSATLPDGATITNKYKDGSDKATSTPVPVIGKSLISGGGVTLHTEYHYETALTVDAIVTEVGHDYATDIAAPVDAANFREAQTPNREHHRVTHTDDHEKVKVKSVQSYNSFGQPEWSEQIDPSQPETQGSTGNPNPDAKRLRKNTYNNDTTADKIKRGRITQIDDGDSDLSTTIDYGTTGDGGEKIVTTDLKRQTSTVEEYDSHDRLIHRIVSSTVVDVAGTVPVSDVLSEEWLGYDYTGRLAYTKTKQKGVSGDAVIATHKYDQLGREIETHMNNAKVDDTDQELVVKSEYDLLGKVMTTFDPVVAGGSSSSPARSETVVDGLGRVIETRRVGTTGSVVKQAYGYDLHGNLCYETDTTRTATLHIFDILGRETRTIESDGIQQERTFTSWSELTDQVSRQKPSNILFAHTAWQYTPKGFLHQINEQMNATTASGTTRIRATGVGFLSSGSRMRSATGEIGSLTASIDSTALARIEDQVTDKAGRGSKTQAGEVTPGAGGTVLASPLVTAKIFSERIVQPTDFDGALPRTVTVNEPRVGASASYQTTTQYDGLGRPTTVTEPGNYVSQTHYDEVGNVVSHTAAGELHDTKSTYDSRGLVIEHKLQDDLTTLHSKYDALGNTREYKDEEGKPTTYDVDDLGRVNQIHYPDGTFERTEFEATTGVVHATRDRKGQWLVYTYDLAGRVDTILDGGTAATAGAGTTPLVKYEYDIAGRVKRVTNANAAIEYVEYDMLNRPMFTRAIRYKSGTGFATTPDVLDMHTQQHVWSVFDGERTRWRMPVAGDTIPSLGPTGNWRSWIDETHDGGGDIEQQRAVATADGPPAGPLVTQTTSRSTGRPMQRNLYNNSSAMITSTKYGYADTTALTLAPEVTDPVTAAPGPASGLLGRVETFAGSTSLAGSETHRTQTKRVYWEKNLGLGDRRSTFGYESDRQRFIGGRMDEEIKGLAVVIPGETLSGADFRLGRAIQPPMLDATQIGSLADLAKEIVPPNWTAPQNDAHQMQTPRELKVGASVVDNLDYAFTGGRRTTSGKWTANYDEFGRLVHVELANDRMIDYVYDPNDRIVGRTAKKWAGAAWIPEDRDPLPASSTFVWDPISDHLLAVYDEGASINASGPVDANAGLVQQYLHGDHDVDDPVDVLIAPNSASVPAEYFPLFDESGSGALQTIFNIDGTLAERVLYADAYGDAPRYLQGALVDQVTIEAEKDNSGNVTKVKIRGHFSEKVDPSTIAGGVAVSSISSTLTPVYTSTITPTQSDAYTLLWTLEAGDWQALTTAAGADSLQIAFNNTLRFAGWGNTPLMKTPLWATKLFTADSSDAEPTIVRERFATLTTTFATTIAGADPHKLYDIPSLYLAASPTSRTRLLTSWKKSPFTDPGSGLMFFRARWYDPATGMWMTPDVLQYRDSSNMYAFCGDDPVNCSDGVGRFGWWSLTPFGAAADLEDAYKNNQQFRNDVNDFASAAKEVGLQTLSNPYVQGMLQVAGGCTEAVAGFAALWTGVGTVPGAVALVHGGDVCQAGIRTLATGQVHETYFDQLSMYALQKAGVSERAARLTTTALDVGLGAYGAGGSARALARGRGASIAAIDESVAELGEEAPSEILQTQKQISLRLQYEERVVDRWLRVSKHRFAQAYRNAVANGRRPFASLIRGRVIDRRMNQWFSETFGNIPGVRIDQRILGISRNLRPDLYFADLGGKSVIFDIGGVSKLRDIQKYNGLALYVIPITY